MNKEMFLKELSDRLQILNEQERLELLEEYAQHIDLKIESGLSEEEAVKDFGTPEELCAELLDVYHINSEYASQSGEKKKLFDGIAIPKLKKEAENAVEKTEEQIAREQEEKRQKEEAKRIKEEERKIKNEETRAKAALWKKERRMKKEEKKRRQKEKFALMREKHAEKKRIRKEYQAQRGGSWLSRFLAGTWDLIVWIVMVCWKFCLFCCAVPVIILGLFALFCTGAIAVLLQQGYPLIGITLICAGVFLGSAGVTGLILSYVFNRRKSREGGKE